MRIYGISDSNEVILAQLQEAMLEAAAVGIAVHKIIQGEHSDIELKIMAYIPGPSKRNAASHNNVSAIRH